MHDLGLSFPVSSLSYLFLNAPYPSSQILAWSDSALELCRHSDPIPIHSMIAIPKCIELQSRPPIMRPITKLFLQVFKPLEMLRPTPSALLRKGWAHLLRHYPGELQDTLTGIIKHGCQIRYKGPKASQMWPNYPTAKEHDHINQYEVLAVTQAFDLWAPS